MYSLLFLVRSKALTSRLPLRFCSCQAVSAFLAYYIWLSPISVIAQPLQEPQRIITTREGLPQSFISGLAQDKNGFIWIGSRNGLARYDGIHFKVFNHSVKDTSTLSSNLIISIAQDHENHIWVEHESGDLDVFDPETESIQHVTSRPLFRARPVKFVRRGWLADTQGNLWCVEKANGLYLYDWKRSLISHYTHQSAGFPSDSIYGLLEDKRGRIWVLTQAGLSVSGVGDHRFRHTLFPFTADFNSHEHVRSNIDDRDCALHERANGEIMLGDGKRLIFFDPVRCSFRTVTIPGQQNNRVRWIQTGPDGKEYLVSNGIVYCYDDNEGLKAIGDIGRPELRNIQSFLIDRSGLIWLGTNAAGLCQIDLHMPFFRSYLTRWSFHQDLLRQELGISLDQFSGWPLAEQEFRGSSYFVRSLYDSRHRLWLGQRNRVGYYDSFHRQMVCLPRIPGIGDPKDFALGIRGLSFSPEGRLWVVADNGYIGFFDSVRRQWTTLFTANYMQKNFGTDISPVDLVAENDRLWISTNGQGLLCADVTTGKIRLLNSNTRRGLFPTDMLVGLQRDPARPNLLWIGSYEGLICLDMRSLSSRLFTTEDMLPDNMIYSITLGKAGYLWLGTNKGLCRFDPVSHAVQVFQNGDGLPGDEFNRFHYLQLPDGRLAFGGTEAWTIFNPVAIKTDKFQPTVAFTGLKINNTPVTSSGNSILPAPLNDLTTLSLPFDKNTLTFEFAGLEYSSPQKLTYRYQLVGYNNDWVDAGNAAVAIFTKLPPGHYTFRISTTNTAGHWSPYIRSITVIIHPPFWKTWWAYTIYALLIGMGIWRYRLYSIRRYKLKQEMELKEREALQLKKLDEIKNRFFSNITHELRTPLTLILTPALRLRETLQQRDQQQWLAAIERNTQRLLRLITQLLDLSKIESGSLRIYETQGSIRHFIGELVLSFREKAEQKSIELSYTSSLKEEFFWFDADKLDQIVGNLLANALKFTPFGEKVDLTLDSGFPEGVYIHVRDTGKGIPAEQLPLIFQRFYQVEPQSSNKYGSGIGLSLVKELVELQKGTIHVESPAPEPWRTVFTVWLPYRNAPHPAASPEMEKMQAPPAADTLPTEERPTILLVEDNQELAGFIADCLASSYEIILAADGGKGLEKAIALLPDVIISDFMMPLINGFDLCIKLKNDELTSHIPFILLTAKAGLEHRLEGLVSGADDYITKPFHVQELLLRVGNLLRRQQLFRDKMRREMGRLPAACEENTANCDAITNDFLQKIYDLVGENLDDPEFSVEELARQVGMSRANLHRKVKTLIGLPTGDLIRNYRLKRAAEYLKQGYNSSETAYKVGFNSPAYFSKCFRDLYQVSPLEFSRMERGE
jgi:signal transduction histidine kinase/DNA-binding response OmpR family regulator/ligand-binding sensor domain-containing protein